MTLNHCPKRTVVGLLLLALTCASGILVSAAEDPTEERFIPNYAAGEAHYLWSTRVDLQDIPGSSLQVQEAGVRVPVPLYHDDDSRLTAGVNFRWNELDFAGAGAPSERQNLYRVQLPFDFWHSFADRWKAWGRIEPGIFSDFKNLDGDAFTVTVLALASYQFTPKFSAAFGVYYSRDLGEDRVLPAIGLIWKPDPHWNIGITFPRASVAYAPNQEWLVTAYTAPGGAGWSVQDATTQEQRRLNYRSWRAGLGVEHQFAETGPAKFWVFAAGGIQFGQELEWKDGDVTVLESDLANGFFLSGGLRLRF